MRLIDVLRVVAPMVGVLAIAFRMAGVRMIRAFHTAGATRPEQAMSPPAGRLFGGFWVTRLVGAGVLQRTQGGLYWLDTSALRAFNQARRKRVALLLAGLAVLFVLQRLG